MATGSTCAARSDTIDSMLDRLDAAFSAQRRLIDDASHELRSPLAIIRANVDTVLSEPDAGVEDRRRAVQVVDRVTTRMTRLVEDLLATARRSAPAFDDADADLGLAAGEAAEEFAALAAARGIHADDQDRVFDRFWRGPETHRSRDRRTGDRRTGLGLAIVRSIVEAHNGHVRLFSAPHVGSTFVLWFPVSSSGGGAAGSPPDTYPLATGDPVR